MDFYLCRFHFRSKPFAELHHLLEEPELKALGPPAGIVWGLLRTK